MKSKTSYLLRIQNLFTHVLDIHSYNTRLATTSKFYVMSSRLEQLKNSFSRFGVLLWNALPENIKMSTSGNLFKKKIHKAHINTFKHWEFVPYTILNSWNTEIKNL